MYLFGLAEGAVELVFKEPVSSLWCARLVAVLLESVVDFALESIQDT